MLAVDFGEQHKSCPEAMVWRRSLGTAATQSDAYLACHRGDWLLWQLERLPREQYEELRPAIQRVREKIVERAIRRGLASIEGVEDQWATVWRSWAERWLNGEDRSAWAADVAESAGWASGWVALWAGSAAWSAALWGAAEARSSAARWSAASAARWAARSAASAARWAEEAEDTARGEERRLQAEEIRREIPTWPGE